MSTKKKSIVLATSDYFLPGQNGGGAVHALNNLVAHLGKAWTFKIVTRDRDLGDGQPYPSIRKEAWQTVGAAQVAYLGPLGRIWKLIRLTRSTEYAIQYHNSFFSSAFTFPLITARRLNIIPRRPLVIAPRGEFSPGALKLKAFKKKLYIAFVKKFGLCRDAVWHVSTEREARDLRRQMGASGRIFVAGDCLPRVVAQPVANRRVKIPGRLRMVSVSRICRMKNLAGGFSLLSGLKGQVDFDIYGPIEDLAYWRECQAAMGRLPQNISVHYRGEIPHEEVIDVMGRYHLFFSPTLGENFGFAIWEALVAGCALLISDRTPWHDLEARNIGWNLPIERPARFRAVLQDCIDMDDEAFQRMSDHARTAGMHFARNDAGVEQSRMLLLAAQQTESGAERRRS